MRPAARYPQPWWRRPGSALKMSLLAHAVLLAALYVFGSYRPAQLAVEARTAQSLSDTLKQAAEFRLEALEDLERELARQPVATEVKDQGEGAERRQAVQQELRAAIEQAKRLIEESEAAPDRSTEQTADAPLDRTESLAQLAQSADAFRAALLKARSDKAGVGESEEGAGVALFDSAGGELLQFEREMRVQADLSRHREQPMQFDGARPPLALDHQLLQQARGLSIGAGGTYANRLYLDRWHVIGPFEPGIGAPLQRAHPPEWAVALEAPLRGRREARGLLELAEVSVATSGDYRHWLDGPGGTYAHTMDPRCGAPLDNGLASVTVLATSCMYADAWATALMVLGVESGCRVARQQGLQAIFLQREGAALREVTVGL